MTRSARRGRRGEGGGDGVGREGTLPTTTTIMVNDNGNTQQSNSTREKGEEDSTNGRTNDRTNKQTNE